MSTELKIIIIGGILTIIAIVLVSILITGNTPSSGNLTKKENIIATNGLHWHPTLSINILGKHQNIPANVGIGAVHQKIHTHDEDADKGVIHMEIPGVVTKEDIKLSNFFRIWGKEFNSTQIFDKKNGNEGKVKMLVNGKTNTDFENYQMRDGDKIEISYN